MNTALKITKIGNSAGVVLPKELLARLRNRWEHGEDDLCALAAAHAFGIPRDQPFTDGNKRTAWVLARTFLVLNAFDFAFQPGDAVNTLQALAAGELIEDELADWFRQHLRPA